MAETTAKRRAFAFIVFDFQNWDTHFLAQFLFNVKKNDFQIFQKLAGLWLVGEVVTSNHHDHVGIYGSKVAEGWSRSNVGLVSICG